MAKTPDNVNLKVKVKRPGKRRVATGWTLLLLGLLVAGVWVWSRWYSVSYEARRSWARVGVGCGTLLIFGDERKGVDFRGELISQLEAEEHRPDWTWIERDLGSPFRPVHKSIGLAWYGKYDYSLFGLSGGVHHRYSVVLWPIPLLLWTPAALLLRSGILARRRAVKGRCAKCGYSLAGLASDAPCPECGKASAAGAVNTPASGS